MDSSAPFRYTAPTDQILAAIKDVAGYQAIAAYPEFAHADLETVQELLREAGNLTESVIAPVNRVGDQVGAKYDPADSSVTTPPGFVAAYRAYVDGGWPTLQFPEEFGGGGFPQTIGLAMGELLTTASMTWTLAPVLTRGAIDAVMHHATDELKARYLPNLISGKWCATMNLTEPQAGSDVGALTTKAVKQDDGTYSITGSKIFITFGEHDWTDQIVHLVLARTPDAPAGSAGISCFIVPKFLHDGDVLGERNGVHCTGIEHKLGIHGAPTCSMSYEGATGYLLGQENRGLAVMFVMMNNARLAVGVEGVGIAERAYQQARAFAAERVQGSIGGRPVTIDQHPDVQRMLLTQAAWIAGLRALNYLTAVAGDRSEHDPAPQTRTLAVERVALLTPIAKSLGTDIGVEVASLAVQVHGGMGYIEEAGAAQHYRDARIAPIYEGTNGIQAADLVGRKLDVRGGDAIRELLAEFRSVTAELQAAGDAFARVAEPIADHFDLLDAATAAVLGMGKDDRLAASASYLRMLGAGLAASLLARSALADPGDVERLQLAGFFGEQLLPAEGGRLRSVLAGGRYFSPVAVPVLAEG
jgi:alkylation response protein AidB-like acyl-CoA dehydrogenase